MRSIAIIFCRQTGWVTCLFWLGMVAAVWGQVEPAVPPVAVASGDKAASPPASTNVAVKKELDLLEFVSGDTLRGKFLGWEGERGIRWQHEGVQGELVVIPEKIRKMRLGRSPQRAPKTMNGRLWLHNGDQLMVDVEGLDAQKGIFNSWYAGTLQSPRTAISNITLFLTNGDLLYHGPTGLDGWQQSQPLRGGAVMIRNQVVMVDGEVVVAREERNDEQGEPAWIFNGEAFEAVRPGSLGRDVKLPRQSMIIMEIETPLTPAFTLHIYSDATDRFAGLSALSFTFTGRMIYFRRSLSSGGSRQIGSADHQKFVTGQPTRVKLTVCTDLDQQIVALFMDDMLVRKFSIAGQVEGLGTGMVIQQQAASSLKISNLTISRWNGVVDDLGASAVALKEDLLLLSNRDKISGKLVGIKDGKVDFQTAFSKIEIPLERIQRITCVPPPEGMVNTNRQVRLVLGDAGRLTLQVRRWDAEVVEGESPVFGSVKIKARAVMGVQYE